MKVILKQDVSNLGDAGDIVDVKDGYGNNYLLPRGLAMRATRGAVKDAEDIRRARLTREARNLDEAREVQSRLEAAAVRIPAKAGEDGTLYGSVGNVAIAEAIKAQTGFAIDRRRIPLERPLKALGEYEVGVKLHPELTATVTVEVVRGT